MGVKVKKVQGLLQHALDPHSLPTGISLVVLVDNVEGDQLF